jgi:hypothetical protein
MEREEEASLGAGAIFLGEKVWGCFCKTAFCKGVFLVAFL